MLILQIYLLLVLNVDTSRTTHSKNDHIICNCCCLLKLHTNKVVLRTCCVPVQCCVPVVWGSRPNLLVGYSLLSSESVMEPAPLTAGGDYWAPAVPQPILSILMTGMSLCEWMRTGSQRLSVEATLNQAVTLIFLVTLIVLTWFTTHNGNHVLWTIIIMLLFCNFV